MPEEITRLPLPWRTLWASDTRTVAGLISGTSLDGVDVVIARLQGSGRAMSMDVLGFVSIPYPDALRALLLRNSVAETSSVHALSQLNVRLAHTFANAIRAAAAVAGLAIADLDLIGSHGQTVHHVPVPTDCAGQAVTSTLQIGDPSVLANLLDVPVVGDFRVADMALGGQGAPLVPYFDYVYFSDADETRGLLNLGGIGNVTILPAGTTGDATYAFDTGPANMVMDTLAQRLLGEPFDRDGATATQGTVHPALLAELLEDDYFSQPPPKSTGRERYGAAYVAALIERAEALGITEPADLLATAALLTVESVMRAYDQFIAPRHLLDGLIVSGGGARNGFLMRQLAARFAPVPVRTADHYGLDSDAKEALCFAVLAHETLNGVCTNLPSVTGATKPTLLGKLCLPV